MASKAKHKIVQCPKLWTDLHTQYASYEKKSVNVAKLVSMAEELEPFDLPIYHMTLPDEWLDGQSMIQMVGHIKMVLDADLSKPIILDADGWVADGKHRLAKALLEGKETIKAVRFEKDIYE